MEAASSESISLIALEIMFILNSLIIFLKKLGSSSTKILESKSFDKI